MGGPKIERVWIPEPTLSWGNSQFKQMANRGFNFLSSLVLGVWGRWGWGIGNRLGVEIYNYRWELANKAGSDVLGGTDTSLLIMQ